MKPPSEKQAAPEIADLLAELLGRRPKAIRLRPAAESNGYDYLISAPGHRFVVEYQRVASAGPLAEAVNRLKLSANTLPDSGQPLIVVPFMGEVGKEICDRTDVSWMDLSGNAKIVAPCLRIHIEGRPNKYSDRGRPPNVFASKAHGSPGNCCWIRRSSRLNPRSLAKPGSTTDMSARSSEGSNRNGTSPSMTTERSGHATPSYCSMLGTRPTTSTAIASSKDMCRLGLETNCSNESIEFYPTKNSTMPPPAWQPHGSTPNSRRSDWRPFICRRCQLVRCSRKSSSRMNQREPMCGWFSPTTKECFRAV